MRALYLSDGRITFRPDYEPAEPDAGLIEVRVLQAGICETDLQLKQGYMGFEGVPGHEFVGAALSGRFAGQRVVGEINCACDQCDFCRRGLHRHCAQRTVIGILNHDGAFAETVRVPEQNLHSVPDHVTTQQAVFTEPVAAACRILEQAQITSSDRVVILGDGRLGNLCAQVLNTTGCRLLVVGKHPWKLDRVQDLGISTVLLNDFDAPHTADYVVDCTGSPSGFETALRTVAPCGTVILKTTVAAPQSLHLAPIVIDEVRILGSRCGPFEPALAMIADGRVQVDSLVSAEYALADGVAAFAHAERPDALKVLLNVAEE
ncbi:MAG: alcohol dehydrogenase catalytic domain-containing protein [Planctomycetaceae bacterium]